MLHLNMIEVPHQLLCSEGFTQSEFNEVNPRLYRLTPMTMDQC
jgi:hypothetical protein